MTLNWRRLSLILAALITLLGLAFITFAGVEPSKWPLVFGVSAALTLGATVLVLVIFASQDDVLLERAINGPLNWLFRLGPPVTGPEAHAGQLATVIDAFGSALRGRVEFQGELWSAQLTEQANIPRVGERVRILEVKGLLLIVAPC